MWTDISQRFVETTRVRRAISTRCDVAMFSFLACAIVSASAPPTASAAPTALDKDALKCRSTIAKNFSKLVKTGDKVVATCHKLRNKEKIPGSTDCNDLGSTQADIKGKFAKASDKLADQIGKKCGTGTGAVFDEFISCPEPCATATGVGNPLSDYDELATCLSCVAATRVETRSDTLLGHPDVGAMSKDDVKCHQTIAKSYGKHLTTILKEAVKCQKSADKLSVFDLDESGCLFADPKQKIAKAQTKALEKAEKKCTAASLGIVDSCSDVSVADLHDCASATDESVAAEMFPVHYELGPTVCPTSLQSRVRAGVGLSGTTASFLDVGWTGIAHDMDIVDDFRFTVDLSCPVNTPCGVCPITGVATTDPVSNVFARCRNDFSVPCTQLFGPDPACGGGPCTYVLGPPLPISAGNNPTCSINVLADDITGTAHIENGDAEVRIELRTVVHTSGTLTRPCSVCSGDVIPRDDVRDGVCIGGARDGLPCDAHGFDATFAPAPAESLSLDCYPPPLTNISGAGLQIDLDLTTGATSLPFADACDAPLGSLACACGVCSGDGGTPCQSDADCAGAGLGVCDVGIGINRQPNGCSDGTCNAIGGEKGVCGAGPDDRYCDRVVRANGRGFLACTSNADCDVIASVCADGDCGTCTLVEPRSCFLDPVLEHGVGDPNAPVLATTFCVPPTSNAAINGVSGLPGPARAVIDTVVQKRF